MSESDMVRRVRRKGSESTDRNNAIIVSSTNLDGECSNLDRSYEVDWTALPDDTVIQLFSCLNYRDRANLASTCQTFRLLASSPCLWELLDLRSHKIDSAVAVSLSSRCKFLKSLQFRGADAANAVISLQARGLREISGDFCQDVTDSMLSVVAARHEMLESLQLGPDVCEKISSDAIKAVAFCCPMLKRLRLSGIQDISGDAINALGKNCSSLVEVAFMDCERIDEIAMRSLSSVRFLSLSGTRNVKWDSASQMLSELPNLLGLDVSRTDISFNGVSRLLSSSQNLKVLLALNCPVYESGVDNNMIYNYKGKFLISLFSDIFKVLASLLACSPDNVREVFSNSRNFKNGDRSFDVMVRWIEWVLSHIILRIAERNLKEFNDFWLKQGAALLLSLMRSSQEDIQERAARAVATFVVTDDEEAIVDCKRTEAVMQNGGIKLLLNLARSCQEEVQSEAAKAIANLSVDSKVAKAVAEIGGIHILSNLARSRNRLVAEEAAGGLWNLSVGEEHKSAIVESGGIKALVDLIFKWSSGGDGVLERAAGALANLAADDKCSLEVAATGGIHALVMLAQTCKFEGVQEQAARALANLAAHGDNNSNNATVGKEAGALEALVQLTCSQHEGVRQEAAGALWNLSFDDKNREAIAASGGVQALVALAQSCSTSSKGLQERAAGALWGLSVSEANSIAIGQEGGVAPLIALARSDVEDVHETAAGALWNLAFNPGNALRIAENGGVAALAHLCSSSTSRMARFMAALALTYMFDGRMDDFVSTGPSSGGTSKVINLDGVRRVALKHIHAFVHSFYNQPGFCTAVSSASPTSLTQAAESARIREAGHLRCSEAEIGRFVTMLRNPSSVLKSCAAFALLQFTMHGGRHAMHHTRLLQNVRGSRVLRSASASSLAPLEVKVFAKIVLRNLEHHTEITSV